jgi:hypothetical protein
VISRSVREAACDCDCWTAAQFADASLLLLNSTNNAVTKASMEMLLGRHITDDTSKQQANGRATLQSLVEAGRLSIRPQSDWALDIPYSRFPASAVIVTAPSPFDLHAMRRMRSQLQHIVEQWQQRKQVCSAVNSSVRV